MKPSSSVGLGVRARFFVPLLAVLLLSAPAVAQALPAKFWGAVPQGPLSTQQLSRVHRGGVESIRIPLNWGAIQPSEGGPFEWSGVDRQVETAASAGLDVLPFVAGAPAWAEPPVFVAGTDESLSVPENLPVTGKAKSGWRAFLEAAVKRYGPTGSFWDQHPGLPKRPMRAWQLWNEENFKYFVRRPDPAEYGQLVKASSATIKAIDPGAEIVLGGLFAWPRGGNSKSANHNLFAKVFLERMFREVPGIASRFDAVALHPYSTNYRLLPRQIEEIRGVLTRHGDGKAGIWITELGWSSKPPTAGNSFSKGIAGQARELKGAFSLFLENRRKWRIQRVYWFSIEDDGGSCNFCDGSGLFGNGFKPKRSWYAYVHFAGGKP